jgi:hypothetical protein
MLIRSTRRPQCRRLAASVAALFCLCPAATIAGTVFVSNCFDNGDPGDLRHSIAGAHEFDTVDVTFCANSTISLHNGEIPVPQNYVTIKGPGVTSLEINGKYNGITQHARIFHHTGSGAISLRYLTIDSGYLIDTVEAKGGCIHSHGDINISNVIVGLCEVRTTTNALAGGGALYAAGQINAFSSVITGNTARAGLNGRSVGGGTYSRGLSLFSSTISYNTATTDGGTGAGSAGGFSTCTIQAIGGAVFLDYSTISGNSADKIGGGCIGNDSGAYLLDSTISGNAATAGPVGGIEVNSNAGASIGFYGSTIAFNTASTADSLGAVFASGINITSTEAQYVLLEDMLIANNGYGVADTQRDLTTGGPVTLGGTNNLIRRAPGESIPADTLHDVCPLLGPLRDNGGPTLTHALLSSSPAIDHGISSGLSTWDQRGSPYARFDNGVADIGAYELQQLEIVFNAGFDGCG